MVATMNTWFCLPVKNDPFSFICFINVVAVVFLLNAADDLP